MKLEMGKDEPEALSSNKCQLNPLWGFSFHKGRLGGHDSVWRAGWNIDLIGP